MIQIALDERIQAFCDQDDEWGMPEECWHAAETHTEILAPAQDPKSAIRTLTLELRVRELRRRVAELVRQVGRLKNAPPTTLVPINTFAPHPFTPTRTIMVVVEPVLDDSGSPCEYIATFADGVVSITGDTVEEALRFLKEQMVAQYSFLDRLPGNRLGRIPQQQLAALKDVMKRAT